MRLTRITITGADDAVDHGALIKLSEEFPFVEWGILRSRKLNQLHDDLWSKAPRYPRYPSTTWRNLLGIAIGQTRTRVQLAAHLCGEISRDAMAGKFGYDACSLNYQRVQLNGFSAYTLPMLYVAERFENIEFILQCADMPAASHAAGLHQRHPNVSILWDTSSTQPAPIRHGSVGPEGSPSTTYEARSSSCSAPTICPI
jgi:hypothetical protein